MSVVSDRVWVRAAKRRRVCVKIELRVTNDKGTPDEEGKKEYREGYVEGAGGVIRMEKERSDPKTQPSGSARGTTTREKKCQTELRA